ncbi:hypothetical protein IE331_11735 [Nocardioides sp. MJB4]|uniref:ARB-07466-like C-terminal domain-containing protein n=1 Tax=Nocardioides donggukensis TaxID=2774019 RepID=A0A927K9L0_9ACTN|nr:hypothetical protein [Nocardioides donggukensis]
MLVVGVLAGTGVAVFRGLGPLPDPQSCTASVDGHSVRVTHEQGENAALIAAVAERRGLPARAVSIALATAYQESKIANIDYGDRDSVGLFQQRPSQGWGTQKQILDPYYATNAFYDELEKIDGYRDMRITEAAQRVQRSGFPEAYEDHAQDARTLASALTGNSPDGRFTCVVRHDGEEEADDLDEAGLTTRAGRVRRDLEQAFGDLTLGGFEPEGVSSGHMPGSAHYDGRAIDVFFRPVGPENRRRGWALAYYLVAHAERLEVDHVIFDGRIWGSGRRSEQGWRAYEPDTDGSDAATAAVLEHRDHVHVDVHD